MDNFHIQPIPLKEIYISVLKEKRVTNEDGWTRKVPVCHDVRPSGSLILDTAVCALHQTNNILLGYELAEKMGVSTTELSGAIHILTGLRLPEFIIHYRSIQAQEYLACTDLPPKEIARRCGQQFSETLINRFRRDLKTTPITYRRKHRPENFRELYRWK